MQMNGWKNKGDTYTIRHKTYFYSFYRVFTITFSWRE